MFNKFKRFDVKDFFKKNKFEDYDDVFIPTELCFINQAPLIEIFQARRIWDAGRLNHS